jgi:hypothetical protein
MIIEKSVRESRSCAFRTRILQIATKTFGAEILVWLMKKPGGRTLPLHTWLISGTRTAAYILLPVRERTSDTFGHFVQPPRFVVVVDISRFEPGRSSGFLFRCLRSRPGCVGVIRARLRNSATSSWRDSILIFEPKFSDCI